MKYFLPMSYGKIFAIVAALLLCIAVIFIVLLSIDNKTFQTDSYLAVSGDSLRVRDAKCFCHLFPSAEIRTDSHSLQTVRPRDICCMIQVFAFNPAYNSFRLNRLAIDVDGTNAVDVIQPSPIDIHELEFGPYICNNEDFRTEFPKVYPRYAKFTLFPNSFKTPFFAFSPNPDSRIQVRASIDILSKSNLVCSTTMQANFIVRREEAKESWAQILLWKLFMPRF